MLKWTGALAAVGVVGVALGFGGEMLLRPNSTKTTTVTQPPTTITVTSDSQTTSNEVLMTAAHDGGPFIAHVVNGVWVKSSQSSPTFLLAKTPFRPEIGCILLIE